ncbi:GDSL-type esterase/lipase family protein, partial [Streptomyces sp. NPDC002884]|uniref:GDSL-type esterase/lipase family protein n=1 Tax=Streptomyces sp. NPDC002884 TaxID=3154544 RepID=UPI003329D8A9
MSRIQILDPLLSALAVVLAVAMIIVGADAKALEASGSTQSFCESLDSQLASTNGNADGSQFSVDCQTRNATSVAADDGVVLSYDMPGTVAADRQKIIDSLEEGGGSLGDMYRRVIEEYSVEMPGAGPGEFGFDADGDISVTDGGLAITIPHAEVQETANWWKGAAATVVGIAAGVVVGVACFLAFAETGSLAKVTCEATAAFTIGFVTTMLSALFKGEEITLDVWGESLAIGIIGAIGAVAWATVFAPWAEVGTFGDVLIKISDMVRKWGGVLKYWGGSTFETIMALAADDIAALGPRMYGYLSAAARRLGFGPTIRVMPLGDSITTGVGSSDYSGYREKLYISLDEDAEGKTDGKGVDFVGSQQGGDAPDIDHEGHSGWRIDQISDFAACRVNQLRPTVVTLHAGTNDLNQFYDTGNAPSRLSGLIDTIQKNSPGVTVVVATLVPTTKPEIQALITPYNKAITDMVNVRKGKGERVLVANMSALSTADLADKLHPNDAGYAKMAVAFDSAIEQATRNGWLNGPYPGAGDTVACKAAGFSEQGKIISGGAVPTARVEAADINGDGYADYLAVAADGSVQAYINNDKNGGNPRWQSYGQFASGVGVSGDKIRFADINGDAYADYLAVADDGSVKAWINNDKSGGNPRWTDYGQWASATGVTSAGQVRFADINGDGYADY